MNFPIVEKRKYFFGVSLVLTMTSIILLFVYGLKPGLDFTGGTLLEVEFTSTRPEVTAVQEALVPQNLGSIVVQPVGEQGLILKTRFVSEEEHQQILGVLRGLTTANTTSPDTATGAKPDIQIEATAGSNVTVNIEDATANENARPEVIEKRLETIGPVISAELRSRAIQTGIWVSLAIIAYIAYSFRKVSRPVQSWKYGLVAVVALFHNVMLTLGVFILLGKYHGVEIDIPLVVALLTILGASVNDTIVVFDRIREKLIRHSGRNFAETVNIAINETIGRSINISLAIVLTLTALIFYGGDSIHYFSLALLIGIIVGTYSSIFVASPLLVAWEEQRLKRRA